MEQKESSNENINDMQTSLDNSEKPKTTNDKFEGKNVSDVIRSYKELESKFGQQSNELGKLRKLVGPLPEDENKSEDNFKQNQEETINENTDNNDNNFTNANVANSTVQANPEMEKVLQSEEFNKWVKTNVSEDLARISDENEAVGNMDVIGLIVDNYKNSSGNTSSLNAARIAAPLPGMGSEIREAPVFSKSQLAKMSPQEYAARNDEILKAYASGRVK